MPRLWPQFSGAIGKINSKLNNLYADLHYGRPRQIAANAFFGQLRHDLCMVHRAKKRPIEQIDHMLGSRLSVYNRKHGRGIKHNTGHS